MNPAFVAGYRDSWLLDEPASDDLDYLAGFSDGQADRRTHRPKQTGVGSTRPTKAQQVPGSKPIKP
jgi:hypothetical protein